MCPLCSQNHALLNCMHYVTASQNIKDFLGQVYDKFRSANTVTWETIYDNVYSKTGDQDTEWEFFGPSTFGVTHRIYLSVKPESLLRVSGYLKNSLPSIPGFKRGKHCRPQDAINRPDTIVIYVAGIAARDAVINHIRMLLRDSDWHQPYNRTPMTLPPRLKASDFKGDVPPGTGRIADLPGVSVADDPGGGDSFGMKLSKAATVALQNKGYLQDRLLFVGHGLACLAAEGFNLRTPWRFA